MKLNKLSKIKPEATSHGGIEMMRKKVIIRKGEIPHLTQFAQGYFEPGSVAGKHVHQDMYEIFLAEEGEVEFIVNDKHLILNKGDCITIESGDAHEVRNNSAKTVVLTYFSILQ